MKKWILLITLAFVLVAVNTMIASKGKILRSGQTMLFELAPVDPRSLIQGDYMALRYQIARQVPKDELKDHGCLVVNLDQNNVGHYVRVHKGEPLSGGEHLLFYRNRNNVKLGAESFLFQESKEKEYRGARYAELKVADDGRSVLAGLRGKDFEKLGESDKKQSET